jgi:hypothetical protein
MIFMVKYVTMRCKKTVGLALGLCVTMLAEAQNSQSSAPAPSYLLRMERAGYLQSVCVLLNADGRYHLERHQPRKVRVFEGILDSSELRDIVRVVSGDPLFRLEQKDIPDLMLKSDEDRVLLEIHRPGSWQQLSFPDSASREPFRDAMVPLLKWLESVNKRKVPEISEEAGRNNCLPPSKSEFAVRTPPAPPTARTNPPAHKAPSAPDVPQPSRETYMLQMFESRLINYQPEVTCLVVSASGSYHLVRQTKIQNKGLSNTVLDGTLSAPQLASLRAIIDAPELVNRPEEKQQGELIMVSDSSSTNLTIPRNGKTQKISTWKSYRIINQVLSRSVEDHGTKDLVPFHDWLRANIDVNAAVPTTTPANPRCDPAK